MKSPAFQFYPRDWLASATVTCMTNEQRGAYIQLLCHDWLNDGIPNDDTQLAVLSGMNEGWLKGGSKVVAKCFIPHPNRDGYLTSDRLIIEREKQAKWIKKSSEGGRKSAQVRSNKLFEEFKGGCQMVARVVQPNVNIASSSASAIAYKNTPISPKGELDDVFEIFWEAYPKKKGKLSALKAWKKIKGVKGIINKMLDSIESSKSCEQWSKDGGQFIPNPASWLNSGGWMDEIKIGNAIPKTDNTTYTMDTYNFDK